MAIIQRKSLILTVLIIMYLLCRVTTAGLQELCIERKLPLGIFLY